MNIFFVSDCHFGHSNILKYQSETRPFSSIEEMDEHIIQVWNDTVKPKDEVYVLGDLSFHKLNKTVELLNRLSGEKLIVIGNHDERLVKHQEFIDCFEGRVFYLLDHKINKKHIVMCHYPIANWHRKHYGAYHLHGHCHGNPTNLTGRIKDIGWDTKQGLYNIEEIIKEMENVQY